MAQFPEYDPVTDSKPFRLLPCVNGRKAVPDPDAEPHDDACGSTCNLLPLEDLCHSVVRKTVSALSQVVLSCFSMRSST